MELVDFGDLDAQVGIMNRRLVALAWMMPPLIFPRSLQVSRTLRAMSELGWKTTVIAVPPDVEPFAPQDPRLEAYYRSSYEIRYVEPREEIQSSPIWLRFVRRILRRTQTRDPNWVRRASDVLCRQIAAERPDALISFAQPWINHRAALRVKRRYPQVPWIAHFSDPWVDSPYFVPTDDNARAKAIEHEREIIATADAVIFTTQETADLVMAKYPTSWGEKVHIIPHVYDLDLLGLTEPRSRSPKITITHTGNLYEQREPYAFLRALATLRAEMGTVELSVQFVGFATQAMQEMVKKLDLEDIVSLKSSVPFLDSLAIAKSADLLLVIDAPAEHSVFLPSKIVDYLSLERPILALTPQSGASARVLGGLGFPTVDPTDEAGIRLKLREALARCQKGESATPLPPSEMLRAFDTHVVAARLEEVILGTMSAIENNNA
jgi:glycosyltransferase involved in cell wall biosynthesis